MAVSIQQNPDSATEFSALQFIIQSILARVGTATLVRVDSCTNTGDLSAWGTVNVQPLISQVSGDNTAVQHGKLFRLPYLRVQGGVNAVILDPIPGDIGIAVFCARDISSLKTQTAIDQVKAGSPGVTPASRRQFSMADGVYLGGILNAQPTQYVRFASDQIEIVSPTKIVLRAPEVEIDASTQFKVDSPTSEFTGDIHTPGTVTGDTDVVGGGISVKNHDHNVVGVQGGGATITTTPPLP